MSRYAFNPTFGIVSAPRPTPTSMQLTLPTLPTLHKDDEALNLSMAQSMPPPPPRTSGAKGGIVGHGRHTAPPAGADRRQKASGHNGGRHGEGHDRGHGLDNDRDRRRGRSEAEHDPYHSEMVARQREASPSSPGLSGRSSPAHSLGRSSGRGSPAHSHMQSHQSERDRAFMERERELELDRQLDQDRDSRHDGRGEAPSSSFSKLFSENAGGGGAGGRGTGNRDVDVGTDTMGGAWDHPTATTPAASSTWSTPKDKRRLSIVELESLGSDAGASYGLLPSQPPMVPAATSPPLDELKPTRDEMRMAKEELLRGR